MGKLITTRSILVAACIVACMALAFGVRAQSRDGIPALPSGIDPSLLSRGFEQYLREGGQQSMPQTLERRDRFEQPLAQRERPPSPPSLLEEEYSRRATRPLTQIGYEVFGAAQPVLTREAGSVQDSYLLGIGDELVIHLRGKVNQSITVSIDREGRIILPELPPMPAAGLSFGEFRQQLRDEVSGRMLGTEAFASVGRIREISITVAGELQNPGSVRLNGLSTLLDAIFLAGGVKRTGSLRDIQVVRQGATIPVDLYDIVLGRSAGQLAGLADGDRIFVPVLGATLAVAGQVKRPGIYEMPPGRDGLSATELLGLAGGELVRGDYRYSVLRIQPNGGQELVNLPRLASGTVRGGEILLVEPASNSTGGRVSLMGHVRLPGTQPLSSSRTVRSLLGGNDALLPDPYLPFAVVEKTDPRTRAATFVKLDLRAVLDGRANESLASNDRLYVLGMPHIRFLTSFDVVEAVNGRVTVGAQNCAGVQTLARWVRSNPNSDLSSGQFGAALRDLAGGPQPCPELFDEVPGLLTYMVRNAVLVRGDVLNPGVYPIASRDSMEEVMRIARSLKSERRGDVAPGLRAPDDGTLLGLDVRVQDIAAAFDIPDTDDAPLTLMSQAAPAWRSPPEAPAPVATEIAPFAVIDVREPRVELAGHVRYAGGRSLASAPNLRDLIGNPNVFEPDPYLLFGVILRSNPVTLLRDVVPFQPAKILSGEENLKLQDRDIVHIFGLVEVRRILGTPESDLDDSGPNGNRNGDTNEQQRGQGQQGQGQQRRSGQRDISGGERQQWRTAGTPPDPRQLGANPFEEPLLTPRIVRRLMSESSFEALGHFVVPARYPLAGTTTLEQTFAAAGGLLPGSDLTQVEVTRFPLNRSTSRQETHRMVLNLHAVPARAVTVTAGDTVVVTPVISDREKGVVEVSGEIGRPGRYNLVRGEKLSAFLERAGGLQPTAYPAGAVFMRDSVRSAEQDAWRRTALEFHRALLARMAEPPVVGTTSAQQTSFTADQVALLTGLLQRLNETDSAGRMVVEMNPLVLRLRPELDVTLEGGDRLFIPRTPLSVFVSGEVFNPGAQQFSVNQTVSDYLDAAGGLTDGADRSHIFIIRPNGSSERISVSVWGRSADRIPPGSWIVIPRDLTPFRFWNLAGSLTQILSSLAVSAASLAVISQN